MRWVAKRRERLLSFLQDRVGQNISGKRLKKALEANVCRVNGKIERFASSELSPGSVVELKSGWQEPTSFEKKFSILYEDEFLKIVSKPSGWICSPEIAKKEFGAQVQLVHRLDKDTTGILLLAKGKLATDAFQKLFEDRMVKKEYLAIVDGIVDANSGVKKGYFAPIRRFEGQTIWGSNAQGLWAETNWEKLATGENATLVRCFPLTGRTHQIRAHMAEINHPILIDRQYAQRFRSSHFFSRTLLHAFRISFIHPFTNQTIDQIAPLPQDFESALKTLSLNADIIC